MPRTGPTDRPSSPDSSLRSERQREVLRMTFLVTIDAAASCHHRRRLLQCHHRRSRRRSEGSGVPHWFSTLAATGDFKGDMHPDDATGSIYRGSTAHISQPSPASVREDAFFAGIGKWRRSRSRYPRGELSFYAQRRRQSSVSAHGPFSICSVWHHLCAEASVRQRLCAQAFAGDP